MDFVVEELFGLWQYIWVSAPSITFVTIMVYVGFSLGDMIAMRKDVAALREAIQSQEKRHREELRLQEERLRKTDAILEKLTEQVAERKPWRPWR